VRLIGVSFDTRKENAEFARTYGYPGALLSDVDREVGTRYETKRHRDEAAPEFAKRRTFLIDPEGVIRKVYRVTDIDAHPGEVLDDLRAFMKDG
jgi:peroxiredoxin Q/BCP